MAKKSKKEVPFKDTLTKGLSLLGAFLALPCVVPQVPWRMAAMDGNLGSRFSVTRSISLFTISNQMQVGVSWMKMRKEMCNKVKTLTRPDPIGMIVGAVGKELVGSGGTLAGCAGWQLCKDHAVMRCNAYSTMAILGIVSIALLIISFIAGVATSVLIGQEDTYKKTSQKEAARSKTMNCSILAFVTNLIAVTAWVFVSDSTFKGLQHNAYYPYPANFVGTYLGAASSLVLFAAMFCGITRVHPIGLFNKTEEPDQEAEEYTAMTGLPMEGMGMGGMGEMPPPMGAMAAPGMSPDMMGGPMAEPVGGAMGGPMGPSMGGPMGSPPPFMRT